MDDDSQRGRRRWRGAATALVLVFALAGAITFLLVVFQPFADAAGGCGGG